MKSWKFSLLGAILTFTANAQSDLLLYNFNAIPQSLHTNPAYKQQTRVWVGLPGISGVQAHYHNNGFALIDLLEKGTHVNANKDQIILALDDKSQITFNQSTDLLGVGFRAWKGFLTIGATQQIDYRMGFPLDLMRLINGGNAIPEHRDLNIGRFGFESLIRTNYYVGFQRNYNERLRLGGRVKFIKGQSHSYVEHMDAKIQTTDSSSLIVETDVLVRTAGVSGLLEGFDESINFFPRNSGFGIDLGGSYDLNDRWNFTASVLDLGFIKWKDNTTDYTSKGSYVYDGLNADLTANQPIESFKHIVDSLEKAFGFKETDGNSYTRALSSRVFLGANYKLTEKHSLGLLYHARIWDDRVFSDMGINYQGRLSRAFQVTVGYSIINGTYNNVGAGFSLKMGPMQLYVISDNVLHLVMYENLQTSNVRAGLNITLYDKKDKSDKRKKDKTNTNEAQPQL